MQRSGFYSWFFFSPVVQLWTTPGISFFVAWEWVGGEQFPSHFPLPLGEGHPQNKLPLDVPSESRSAKDQEEPWPIFTRSLVTGGVS